MLTCFLIGESMHGSRTFCQRGSNFDNVLLCDEGREDPNTTINGSSLARQQNANCNGFAGEPVMAQY